MSEMLANKITEVICIGLPGPTHNYGGLSADNLASSANQGSVSAPREAALQAIALARLLLSLGQTVAILPPHPRPYMPELRKYFSGDDALVIAQAGAENPTLLEAVSSSSFMWTANAATVTPSIDSEDGMLRLTVANLHTNMHRRIEALVTYRILRQFFAQVPKSAVDLPLDAGDGCRDEGAANHMRLAPSHSTPGLNVFVYGTDDNPRDPKTARQTLSASQAIAARHKLRENAAIFVKQNPLVIEQGVFHNDVIAVSNENLLLAHEDAFAMGSADLDYIRSSYHERTGNELNLCVISRTDLSVEEAVATYFFNSQLITMPDGGMAIIAPSDTQELYDGKAWALIERLVADPQNPIRQAHVVNLKQSMRNGGGPACLRLRVPMDERQIEGARAHHRAIVNEKTLLGLEEAVRRTYPETLHISGINADLCQRSQKALAAVYFCLGLEPLGN